MEGYRFQKFGADIVLEYLLLDGVWCNSTLHLLVLAGRRGKALVFGGKLYLFYGNLADIVDGADIYMVGK